MNRSGFMNLFLRLWPLGFWIHSNGGLSVLAKPVVVATYNVENFHIRPYGNRPVKSEASRATVAAIILAIQPDIIAIQEMGELGALESLQETLQGSGLTFPFREHLGGADTNIFVALLSRFPIVSRHPHTNDGFVLDGRRFHSSRSTIDVVIEVDGHHRLTILSTHLKSKRPVPFADEAELREQEARILREHVDNLLATRASEPLIVCGDFNDTPASKPIRLLAATGRRALFDPRPAEMGSGISKDSESEKEERRITWTHFYPVDDTYSRIDYLLMSRSLRPFWIPEKSYVYSGPNWGEASDHRPVVCTFDFDKN